MASYKTRYGVDWPAEMTDELIGMTIGKKWVQYRDEFGVEFKDPWVPLIDAAKSLLPERMFKVSEWDEQHFHDWVMAPSVPGKGAVTWGCASCGKAVMLTEKLHFPDHIGTFAEVKVGSEIIASTGSRVTVTGVYDQLDEPLYRVKFSDGAETVCAGSHLWTVRYWGRTEWVGPRSSRRAQYGWITRTVSASRLASWKPGQLRRRRTSVPLTDPVRYDHRCVPLDPYVLGCLIGDGCISTGMPSLASVEDDVELRDEFAKRLPAGYHLTRASEFSYSVSGSGGRNKVKQILADLGLYGCRSWEKFIPELYKVNSLEVRFDLLAGLFDTDGTVDKSGRVSFCTTSERLRDDVKMMLESVGARVAVQTRRPKYKKDGEYVDGRTAYIVYAYGMPAARSRRLFKLSRKRDRIREVSRNLGLRPIESVELVENRSDFPRETRCITIAGTDVDGNRTNGLFPCGEHYVVTHNSNDYGLLMVLDWMTDPFDTAIRLGSTDKVSLKSRSWESVLRYFTALKHNDRGLVVPGKVSKSGYAILNDDSDDKAESIGEKAGIIGVAVNDSEDSGKLQGAHAKYVRLVIDELATITHHGNIAKAMANLRVGAQDFRFFALANPASWEDQSCQYCMPPGGPESVNVDTGYWVSTRGYIVRHHDGMKSPALESPEKAKEFPYLITRENIDQNLGECDGNEDAPLFWQMVRGFPPPQGTGVPTVLDPKVARDNRVSDPPPTSTVIGCSAGADPAWSEGGDGAIYTVCKLRVSSPSSYPVLDFTDEHRLKIMASSPKPVMQQQRDQILALMRDPGRYTAALSATAVDASANQGLADELDIYVGQGVTRCIHVNFWNRASEFPVRANSDIPANKLYRDRATEAWCVLAMFCKAGMVRGLSEKAVRQLCTRRFVTIPGSTVPKQPLQLEPKEQFKDRTKSKSPDEADSAALAALAAKEALGILPYGWLPAASRPLVDQPKAPQMSTLPASTVFDYGQHGDAVDDMDVDPDFDSAYD